jgi:hypothetical protein
MSELVLFSEPTTAQLVEDYIKSYNRDIVATAQRHLTGYGQRQTIREELARRFGEQRGWTPMRLGRGFGFNTLAKGGFARRGYNDRLPDHRCMDHAYFYHRDRFATAIAAHIYNWPNNRAACEAAAQSFGLRLEVPDFPSWHHSLPGGTTLIVYVGPRAVEDNRCL